MASRGVLAPVRVVAIRIDQARYELSLHLARRDYGLKPGWTIDSIPDNGLVAVNAGHFTGGFPWGWLVRDKIESQPPGRGSLAMALVVDDHGRVSLLMPGEIGAHRGKVVNAFQSYPAILVGGKMPWELRSAGRGVDLEHRDSRLAICTLREGSIVIALTRFTSLGEAGSTLPWGPTVPEMAAYMRSLGCDRAMLLDGGISSQMSLRTRDGKLTRWTNWRAVPLGLIITARKELASN